MTRVELMLGLALTGALVGGFVLFSATASAGTDRREADSDAKRILSAAEAFRQEAPGVGCPTVSRLIEDGRLKEDVRADDPWGERYRISCDGAQTLVRSAGRDGIIGTDDDVRAEGESS